MGSFPAPSYEASPEERVSGRFTSCVHGLYSHIVHRNSFQRRKYFVKKYSKLSETNLAGSSSYINN